MFNFTLNIAKRSYLIFLILMTLFLAPGMLAYCFFTHPQWLKNAPINKGVLLTKPIKLVISEFKDQLYSANKLPQPLWAKLPKWYIISINTSYCKQNYRKQLMTLVNIRLALGRHYYRTEQWLITLCPGKQATKSCNNFIRTQNIKLLCLRPTEFSKLSLALPQNQKIFIADPAFYLILGYASLAKPQDLFTDLKRLINAQTSF